MLDKMLPSLTGTCIHFQRLDVLACRGTFLCPAVASMWIACNEKKKAGKLKAGACESEKAALEVCLITHFCMIDCLNATSAFRMRLHQMHTQKI